jgi:hypothetical protein
LSAVSIATIHAARRPNSASTPQNATGIASSAKISDSACVAFSPLPASAIQTCSSA